MDKILYLLTNCGHVEKVYDTAEERDKALGICVDNEKHYTVTHYYYSREDVTRGEYVCDRICQKRHWNREHYYCDNKDTGEDALTFFKRMMHSDCLKCPLKKYSRYLTEAEK